jgi:rubrerythrin
VARRRVTIMDWLNFLKIMAIEEHAAQAKYQLAMDLADDEKLKAFFARLRDEEAFHAQFLEGEYQKLEKRLKEQGGAARIG